MYGLEYPYVINCDVGKVSPSFISVKIIISMFPIIIVFSCLNLLARELILILLGNLKLQYHI